MAKTIEHKDENSRRKIDRRNKTGAILSQDYLNDDPLRNGSAEESIYSSFEEESIERLRFAEIVSIGTLEKSVLEVLNQTKLKTNFLKKSEQRP